MRLPDGHAYLLRTAINVSNTYGYDLELIRSFKTIHEQLSSPKDVCARALLCVQKPFPQTHLSNALFLINGNTLYSLLLSLYLIKSILILEETAVKQSFKLPPPPRPPKKVYFHLFPSLGCQGSSSLLVSLAGVFSLVTQRSSRRSVAWRD